MNCKIIGDLLPLYHDDVVSEESRALVEEHLNACAECRKTLEDIHGNIKIKNVPGAEPPAASGFKTLKKRLRRKTVLHVALSLLCAVAAVAALTYGVFFYETPVSYREMMQTITQPIRSASDFVTKAGGHNSVAIIQKEDALYICCSDTFWTRYIVRPDSHLQLLLTPPAPPTAPAAPIAPDFPGIFDDATMPDIPEPSEPPEAPNPLALIGEATKVFYLEGDFGKLSCDDAAFARAAADAVLLWEK